MSVFRFLLASLHALLVAVVLALAVGLPNVTAGQNSAATKPSDQSDPYRPLRPFLGKWEGDSQGQPGVGKMQREYRFVLRDKFVQVSNTAVYPPQKKNPKGETHEDMGFFGYDRALKKLS
jgi:hypothetical protein